MAGRRSEGDGLLRGAVCCETGRRRPSNQDNFCLGGRCKPLEAMDEPVLWRWEGRAPALCAVCDGMGGLSGGALAAALTAHALDAVSPRLLERPEDAGLAAGCLGEISRQIRLQSARLGGPMGAAVVLALVHPGGLELYSLGDSRGYLYTPAGLMQLTRDHTTAQSFRDMGLPPPPPGQDGLTQYLGMDEEEYALEPFCLHTDFPPGARLLLCSDGLTAMVDDGAIKALLARPAPPEEAVRALADAALAAGGRDNITALVVERAAPA